MTTVAVSGVSGYLGGALVRLLAHDPEVERIIGIDVLEPAGRPDKLVFHRLDIRSADLAAVLRGADSVVHLAFLLGPESGLVHDVNVGGLQNVLRAMDKAGVRHLVYPSSALAYGAHPGREGPLSEDEALRPNQGSVFAEQKAECEAEIEAWLGQQPEATAAVLRLAMIFGPNADNSYTRILEHPVVLSVRGHAPPLSVVHEDDAAAAVHFAVARRLAGVFNVAADEPIPRADMMLLCGRRSLAVSEQFLTTVVDRLGRMGLLDIPVGEVPYHVHPWVVSNAKLREEGWAPLFSAREAVAATCRSSADYVSIGVLRATKADWARSLVAAGAGAVVAAGLAGVTAARLRRSRRARGGRGGGRRRGGGGR